MTIAFDKLVGLLGKTFDDPAVVAVLAKSGKYKKDSDFIIAKEAGFDFSLDDPPGATGRAKKVLTTLFLFDEGRDGHKGYKGLPKPFRFGTRTDVIKGNKPDSSWNIDDGDVPVASDHVERDTWNKKAYEISTNYSRKDPENIPCYFTISLPEEAAGGRDIDTYPLHFEDSPMNRPDGAEELGMAFLVAWGAHRFGLAKKHAKSEDGKKLVKRAITPLEFLKSACKNRLTTIDFDLKLSDFLYGYTHSIWDDPDAGREAAGGAIKKALGLPRKDEQRYTDDYIGTFKPAVKNVNYVPNNWDAFDRIAPILDARWADYQATKFKTKPDLALYDKAAKLRDKVKLTPWKKETERVGKQTADDSLALDLLLCVMKPLADKHVKATLSKAELPMGYKIDEQANPVLGVSYMGTKIKVGTKRVMGCEEVTFYGDKQKAHLRATDKDIVYRAYPGKLPLGIEMGMDRKAVTKLMGKPAETYDDSDVWFPRKDRRVHAVFSKKTKKLVQMGYGIPADWVDPPKPPFGPAGIW